MGSIMGAIRDRALRLGIVEGLTKVFFSKRRIP